ncbi:UNVERIFIED_CONTAM: flagellar FliJ protein [Acetivibrio alkalicellulosi]
MGNFIFRLQSLLNVKKQIEESLKNELGKAVLEYENQKNTLNQIENEKEELIGHINDETKKGILISVLRDYRKHIEYMNDRVKAQKEKVMMAGNNVDKYREELIKAAKEKQILEKLREKKYTEYQKEQLKKEQNFNDEIAAYKYIDI